ncbi:MAG: MBL fold metallo-hydrolase [bacterium]
MTSSNKKIYFAVISFWGLLCALAWVAVWDLNRSSLIEVNFFNVGQGDSLLIQISGQNQILIDGGPDNTILEKLGREMPFWDRTIELVVLTHPEEDHLSGLIEVLKRYEVENILVTGVAKDTGINKKWLELVKQEKAVVWIAEANLRITCGNAVLEILYPSNSLIDSSLSDYQPPEKNINNTSIVSRLLFGSDKFLFTGDISKSLEKELLAKEVDISADVLKVAHHGSSGSTSEAFVVVVAPEIAVISVGEDNKFGHPRLEVLEILEKSGIRILRTDQQGDVKIQSDGENLSWEVEK